MARIPTDELERLKREISLERLVEAKGIKLERHGQDLIGLCPFHDDKSPSLVVSPKSNLWHCLGACQAGGSVIDWVMKAEGVSFRHAVEMLRNDSPSLAAKLPATRIGRPPEDGRSHVKKSTVRHLEPAFASEADAQTALQRAIAYYHETLKESPEALAYLEKRGLESSELIEQFRLGFCDRSLCYRLPQKNRKVGADLRSTLQSAGILRESGHEHFRGSLVVPVFDAGGQVVEVYGRKINDNLRTGTPKHLYLPGPHRGVWNIEALEASKEIILCEALIDAMTFWCAGFRNVTSAYGIEGFCQDHLEAFERHGTERVLIAYDRDDAGDKAAEKLSRKLGERGIDCFRIQFPKGMDANAYALHVAPASRSLGVAIRAAVWMGTGKAPKVTTAMPESSAVETSPASSVPEPEPSTSELGAAPAGPAASVETQSPLAADSASLPASPLPPAPRVDVDAEVKDQEVVLCFGDRRWRVRGLAKNMSYDLLRVNLLCSQGERFHVDTFDLYSARHRASYLKHAAEELQVEEDVLKRELGRVLLKLEDLQDQQIKAALSPKDEVPEMSEAEREEALALLRDPNLLERILEDFDRCGVVGEETNKLCGYLAAVSRKLAKPLAVIIQSTSAAGKSALMDAVLAFVPSEDSVKYSAMTGQSLFYMGETSLQHKVLAIVEEEGAERASYALKLLQSEGEITIASTGKDPATGRHVTQEYHTEGPVGILLTTTAIDVDEELLNRTLVLTVNECREQTRAIHRQQRSSRKLEGLLARQEREVVTKRHQNAQRLLRPLPVVNPFVDALTFPDARTRTRRDHEKYLTLIDTLALLHQHQRPKCTARHQGRVVEYIEVTAQDIALANRLAEEVLGRSLDELPPQTRRMLEALQSQVESACAEQKLEWAEYRFTRRQVREATGCSLTQVRVHLERLVALEYVAVHRGRSGQRFVYELLHTASVPDRLELIDIAAVDSGTTPTWPGVTGGDGSGAARSNAAGSQEKSATWRPDGASTSTGKKTARRSLPLVAEG
jgi:DNA primase catalytic core